MKHNILLNKKCTCSSEFEIISNKNIYGLHL